jgi:hypothetical protein
MKQEIKRIEATLQQLTAPQPAAPPATDPPSLPPSGDRPLSFEITPRATATKSREPFTQPSAVITDPALQEVIEPFCINAGEMKLPTLPRVKSTSFTTHRNAANPALATNLLKELQTIILGWQQDLQQVLRQIQDLYLEGPIVDGWLESYTCQDGEAPEFRHAEVDCLMNYVEKLSTEPELSEAATTPVYNTQQQSEAIRASAQANATGAGYRLCGLNEDGQLWFRHCPAEQVPAVSLAIVRYQRLRTLLNRKQDLENRLCQLSETLVMVHSQFHQR